MTLTKSMKKYLILGLIFSLFAITFALLYLFGVVKHLTLITATIYVLYFVGIALIYNASYCKRNNSIASSRICAICGTLAVLVAVALLIYGFVTNEIALW